MSKKVILEPSQLVIVNNCLFASLWDITSSDLKTHEIFCTLAMHYQVFRFWNSGVLANPDVPYTSDDGQSSIVWLENICNLIVECNKHKIDVVVKLDKTYAGITGVQQNYSKPYPEYTANRLIDTYFLFLINLFNKHNLGTCISTKCKKFDAYNVQVVNDGLCVQY